MKAVCEDTGFFCISGHQCTPGALEAIFETSRPFFDLTKSRKLDYVVAAMRAGRGYEVSSEHRDYEQWLQACARDDEELAALLQVCTMYFCSCLLSCSCCHHERLGAGNNQITTVSSFAVLLLQDKP